MNYREAGNEKSQKAFNESAIMKCGMMIAINYCATVAVSGVGRDWRVCNEVPLVPILIITVCLY